MPQVPSDPGAPGLLAALGGHNYDAPLSRRPAPPGAPLLHAKSGSMLQAIRSKVGSWVVKILFVLLIISFAVWGIGDLTTNVSNDVAEVGDTTIDQQELDRAFRDEVARLRQMLGPDLTSEQARQLGVLDQALERLIQQRLLLLNAREKGLRVGDAPVARTVAEFPAFRNAFGQFDANVMRALLAQAGMSEAMLVEQIRGDIARQQLVDTVAAGATAPRPLAEAVYRYRGERRIADVILIPAASMPAPPPPEEAVLAQYHQDEAVRYTAPEYRTLTVASLSAADLADEIAVSEEDLREAYAARSAEFIQPEVRDLSQVVLADEAAARAVADAVAGGQTLEDAAKAAGAEAVTLDDVTQEDLLPELAGPAFELAQGATSQPIQSPLGWHVVTAREVTPGGETPFEQARDELLVAVREERALDRLFEVSNAMDDALAGGASVEEAAAKVGATVVKLEQVDNTGAPAAGGAVAEVPGLATILETGFALGEGETSNVTETQDSGYVAVRVDAVTPAALRPLDGIRDQVVADWTAARQAEAARKAADEAAARLREGAAPDAVAQSVPGARTVRTGALPRNPPQGQQLPLPRGVLNDLFGLPAGGVTVGDARDGMVIAKLVEVVPADPAGDAATVTQVADSLRTAVANDLVEQYLAGLRQRHAVTVNRNVVDSLYQDQ